jgi:hypothetical protein
MKDVRSTGGKIIFGLMRQSLPLHVKNVSETSDLAMTLASHSLATTRPVSCTGDVAKVEF